MQWDRIEVHRIGSFVSKLVIQLATLSSATRCLPVCLFVSTRQRTMCVVRAPRQVARISAYDDVLRRAITRTAVFVPNSTRHLLSQFLAIAVPPPPPPISKPSGPLPSPLQEP
ncbi:hypothetical protein BHE74_00056299 [Ensete ventricosum]|nr:hypothetical protein BHE74_00056299 [Ensete ventricosum]